MIEKYYVTLTWHDWPEGGSYGTVVEAKDYETAEQMAREEMAATYSQEIDHHVDPNDYKWHLVDCFKVDDFIKRHME